MSKMVFQLNRAGVSALLKGPEMQKVLISHAKSIQNRAGDGYSVYVGRNRANVSVHTASEAAEQDNYNNNTLLKAVRG